MEYKVVEFFARDASAKVKPYLAQGWAVYGNPVYTDGFYKCLQTLVKRPGVTPGPITDYMVVHDIGMGGYEANQRVVQTKLREGWSLHGDPVQAGTNTMGQALVKPRPPLFPPPPGRGRTRRQRNHQ